MNLIEKQKLIRQLKADYRHILIDYFINESDNLSKIDNFINSLFYANIPVPKIIEMHMEVMDDFSNQLKIEGRDDEVILDYRLVLIDILAHLCELYRYSMKK
ncbi:MAG: circadian clock protein KaiA [Richelia sp.]|nr:circadian clock protein KaiA [Richelia sp.]CDN10998.1 Circadian clock protein KaiA [Richelia intracellularis]